MPDLVDTDATETLRKWREFADAQQVTWAGRSRSWHEHISQEGYVDEERLVQPVAFPAFARALLGYEPGADLAAEETGAEGTPDFTPADAVTHPFVFETKGTSAGVELAGHAEQVRRYLRDGRPRIRKVVLTNLVAIRVFSLAADDSLREDYAVNLRGLLSGPLDVAARTGEARRLARFVSEFSHRVLTRPQKLAQMQDPAGEWNPLAEITSSDWVLKRLDRVVRILADDVDQQVTAGLLLDNHVTSADERLALTSELRLIATRLGVDSASEVTLRQFVEAGPETELGKARRQYCAHVAYFAAIRLTLVRIWEDIGLLEPMLRAGGFREQMTRFEGVVAYVVEFAFNRAQQRYRSLFSHRNGYSWYAPSDDPLVDVLFELANTYLGTIQSDVFGYVYELMLERIDRKLLGQYYTPRDIIALMWDLIDLPTVVSDARAGGRPVRVLDIATGSGGFLVEAAARLRRDFEAARRSGADMAPQAWVDDLAEGLNGIEVQRFSSYLAELNLLVQIGQFVASDPTVRVPPLGILSADSLSLHEPVAGLEEGMEPVLPNDLLIDSEDRRERALRIKAAASSDFLMDVACGNPPYIGEKLASPILNRTRQKYPYWEQFVGPHLDYLYWFLILGVSKLREGGRFSFITTEYWLRAAGAAPLRQYLAERCEIDKVILFRDMRLFPDAQGQHSMVISGRRVVPHDAAFTGGPVPSKKPRVSIYEGGPVRGSERQAVLAALRAGRRAARVRSFTATASPNALARGSWADLLLSREELQRRAQLKARDQLSLLVTKGVETTVNALNAEGENYLSQRDLSQVGGPGSRAGIQLLSPDEVAALGPLSPEESAAIRKVVNTRDVYPYAVVLPASAPSIVYLSKPPERDLRLSDEAVVRATPFPEGMPTVERRLSVFRALLEQKTLDRNERRPWWSLHRPRPEVVGDRGAEGGWAPYCVTTRWGNGGRLVVGLCPAGSSPASGLHVLRVAHRHGVPAAYLAALYNSRLFQEVAKSLPPGQLRQKDLENLGLPDVGSEFAKQLCYHAEELASVVVDLVANHGEAWPRLADELRNNLSLSEVPEDAWVGRAMRKSPTGWGPLQGLSWVDGIEVHRAASTQLGSVSVSEDLYGLRVVADVRGQQRPAVSVRIRSDELRLADVVAARVRGLASRSGRVRDLLELRLPVSEGALIEDFSADHASLSATVERYRSEREDIECLLQTALD